MIKVSIDMVPYGQPPSESIGYFKIINWRRNEEGNIASYRIEQYDENNNLVCEVCVKDFDREAGDAFTLLEEAIKELNKAREAQS